MGLIARFFGVTALLLFVVTAPGRLIRLRYGFDVGRRFARGAAVTILAQQALVGLASRQRNRGAAHRLSLVDLMTLSRGGAAAVLVGLSTSGVRDRRGPAGWIGWLALLYGAILCDWLDGPIARHLGTSEVGAVFDLEADSWLTLMAAVAATRWGGAPRVAAAPPFLRYLFLASALRIAPYAGLHVDEPRWVRRMGIVQMLVFIAALAPFGDRMTRFAVRIAAPIQTPFQIAGLAVLHRRRLRL